MTATTRARTAVAGDSEDELFAATRARTDAAEILTTPTRAVPDDSYVGMTPTATHEALSIGATPSTPDEQRQLDDDNCTATRAEFRKMKKQLKETRLAVNALIQRRLEDDQLLDMNHEQLMELFTCRIRRKFARGIKVHF